MNEKKKIFLRGCHNLFNFGDDLILILNIELLKELGFTNENLELFVSKNFESLSKLKIKNNLELKYCLELSDVIYRINLQVKKFHIPLEFPPLYYLLNNIFTGGTSKKLRISSFCLFVILIIVIFTDLVLYKIFRKALFTKEYVDFLKSIDLIHYVGGGYFTDRWIEVLICECIIVVLAKTFNPSLKVIGTGLGLGPFKNKLNLRIFKFFTHKFDYLFVRETESIALLEDLKVNVYKKVLGDDAILLLPYLNKLRNERNLNCTNLTALNLKSFPDHDYSSLKESIENYIKLLECQNSRIEYFCFGRKPGPDDRSLLENFDKYYKDKLVIHDPYETGWTSFIENLAQANVGLGFAYHFNVILTLLTIPVVSVYSGDYYRQKIAGVIKLLNKDSIVLSIDELSEKNLVEVLNLAKGSELVNVEERVERMYKEMKTEYLSAYKSVLSNI